MANNRKLQGEIDKLLKKIQEGMEIYDEIAEKVSNASEKSLKERIEGDLKSQIKKLQRCRDSVKQYVANSEVKDKKALEEARRAIERKMEAFKVTERETKTKAFSKEGLIAAARDPNDPKSLTSVWLREAISELKEKIEQLEFDVENEAAGGGKKGKTKAQELEERLDRSRHHVFRLEQLLRLLNRDELEASDINDIKENVLEFVENCLDLNYEEIDPEMYEMFGLPDEGEDDDDDDDESDAGETDDDDDDSYVAQKRKQQASNMSRQASSATVADSEKKAPTPSNAKQAPTPTSASKKQPAAAAAAAAASSPSPTSNNKKTPTTSNNNSSASLMNNVKQTPNSPNKSSLNQFNAEPMSNQGSKENFAAMSSDQFGGNNNNEDGLDDDDAFNDDTFGDDAMNAVSSGATLGDLAAMSAQNAGPGGKNNNNNKISTPNTSNPPTNVWAAKKPNLATTTSSGASSTTGVTLPSGGPTLDSLSGSNNNNSKNNNSAGVKSAWSQPLSSLVTGSGPKLDTKSPSLAEMFGGSKDSSHQPTPSKAATTPSTSSAVPPDPAIVAATPSTSNVASPNKQQPTPAAPAVAPQPEQQQTAASVAAAASAAAAPTNNVTLTPASTMRMLDMSVRNLPQASDVERLKPYVPANPQQTPSYYPQKIPACFSNPELFQKFEPDTLFFIFYYQQGTYQHYLAAKELKRNSYRFHKKFTTWFQRHDRPKSLNEEQEQGTYVYFDFESGWCQRIKNDFSFRYTYLENELV